MSLLPIDERRSISLKEFRDAYLLPQRPVILRAAIAHWPAVEKWSPAYLRAIVAGWQVTVRSKSDYGDAGSKRHFEAYSEMDFADVVDMMVGDDAPDMSYARQTTVWKDIPELLNDVGSLGYGPANLDKTEGNLWLGPSGTVAQMHWDPLNNLFAQIRGEKKWILVSPSESHLTHPNQFSIQHMLRDPGLRANYPVQMEELSQTVANATNVEELVNTHLTHAQKRNIHFFLAGVNNCDVNAEFTDLTHTPRFADATRYEGVIGAGDLIFIPACWRHYVRALSPSISMNWFFNSEQTVLDDAALIKTLLEHLTL